MLRSVHRIDMNHNPYANRKMMMPRIEDLLPFDDHGVGGGGEYKLPARFNGSAFVMNLHNTTGNSSVQTAALQDLQSGGGGATGNSNGGSSAPSTGGGTGSGGASGLGEIHIDTTAMATGHPNHNHSMRHHAAPELDIFLSPHLLQEQRSIWEQNLADLQDYNDLPQASPYANLPLKDGQQQAPNSSSLDLSLAALLHGFAGSGSHRDGSTALNDSTPNPGNLGSLTVEQFGPDEDDNEEDLYLCRLFGQDADEEDVGVAANACEVEGLTTDEPFGSATFGNEVEVVVEDEHDENEEEEVTP